MGDVETPGNELEAALHLELVRGCDFSGGMVRIGELSGYVDLRATAIVWAGGAFADPVEVGVEFGESVGWMLGGDAVPGGPEFFVFALEEGGDEVILGGEVAVEAGFGDAGLVHDQVDADCADALLVEEGAGCGEDSVADLGVGWGVCWRMWNRRPPRTSSFLTWYRPVRMVCQYRQVCSVRRSGWISQEEGRAGR